MGELEKDRFGVVLEVFEKQEDSRWNKFICADGGYNV